MNPRNRFQDADVPAPMIANASSAGGRGNAPQPATPATPAPAPEPAARQSSSPAYAMWEIAARNLKGRETRLLEQRLDFSMKARVATGNGGTLIIDKSARPKHLIAELPKKPSILPEKNVIPEKNAAPEQSISPERLAASASVAVPPSDPGQTAPVAAPAIVPVIAPEAVSAMLPAETAAVSGAGISETPANETPAPEISASKASLPVQGAFTFGPEWLELAKWVAEMYRLVPEQERFTKGLNTMLLHAKSAGSTELTTFLDRVLRIDPETLREQTLDVLLKNPALRSAADFLCSQTKERMRVLTETSRLAREEMLIFPWNLQEGTGALLWIDGEGIAFDPDADFLGRLARIGCSINDMRMIVSTRRNTESERAERLLCHIWNTTHSEAGKRNDFGNNDLGNPEMSPSQDKPPRFAVLQTGRSVRSVDFAGGQGQAALLPVYGPYAATRSGLSIRLNLEERNGKPGCRRTIVWTGPTDLFNADASGEIWQEYLAVDPESIDLMFLHVGAINDFGGEQGEPGLGLSGAARILGQIRPKLAVLCGLHGEAVAHQQTFAEALNESLDGAIKVIPLSNDLKINLSTLETATQ